MKNHINKILFLLIISFASIYSQSQDSTFTYPELRDSGFVMQKSPTGAMLRSVILPGWGQFYNESYWKIPIIWGLSAWFIYNWDDQNNLYLFYKKEYNNSLDETSNGDTRLKEIRNFYKDQRDLFAIYLGLTYFLNFIDAYVDAHLFDFDVVLNKYNNNPELQIRLNL